MKQFFGLGVFCVLLSLGSPGFPGPLCAMERSVSCESFLAQNKPGQKVFHSPLCKRCEQVSVVGKVLNLFEYLEDMLENGTPEEAQAGFEMLEMLEKMPIAANFRYLAMSGLARYLELGKGTVVDLERAQMLYGEISQKSQNVHIRELALKELQKKK